MTRFVPVLNEGVWRRAQSDQARRERLRLLKKGTIRPIHRIQPQMLLKEGDRWVPALVINGQSV